MLPGKAGKKDVRSLMKGVVVKKKPAAGIKASTSSSGAGSSTGSAAGSGAGTPANGASRSNGGSGSATPTAGQGGRTLATANEMRNSQMVGAAGMTALGKRLVQDSPSPSPSPSPPPLPSSEPKDTTTGTDPSKADNQGAAVTERSEKRARIEP